jgi:hypothetical protein
MPDNSVSGQPSAGIRMLRRRFGALKCDIALWTYLIIRFAVISLPILPSHHQVNR